MDPSDKKISQLPKYIEEETMLEEETKPVMFAMMADSRSSKFSIPKDGIYDHLMEEIFDPNPLRNHVITLHLYVEYWLDKILNGIDVANIDRLTFNKKVNCLNDKGIIEEDLYNNIVAINRLRNVYAHELNLEKANKKVMSLLQKMKTDPYFVTTDDDHFRSVCLQSMMLLEATFANGCKSPRLSDFPHKKVKEKLLKDGQLFWQECEIIDKKEYGYISKYQLRCPLCLKGVIEREKDNTPGFKESDMCSCNVCGLSGNGSMLKLETASGEYKK